MSELFTSAEQCNRYIINGHLSYSGDYIRGDVLEVGCGNGSFYKTYDEQSEFDSLSTGHIKAGN